MCSHGGKFLLITRQEPCHSVGNSSASAWDSSKINGFRVLGNLGNDPDDHQACQED